MATATINGMTTFGSSGSGADAGWGNIGGGPGGGQNTDDFIEGTDSFGGRKTATGRGLAYTLAAGSVDMSTTTTHVYCWINCKSIGSLDLIANGGMILRVGSDATNYRSFYIGGSDTVKAGWQLYVIDPTKTGSIADTGTPNMAAVTYIGVELTIASAVGGTSDNILMDIIRYTTGPYITGGTTGDRLLWSDIAAADASSAFGLIQERSGVYFCAGQIALGAPSGTGDCYLDDEGQVLVWEPKEYENGTTIVTALASGFNSLIIQEGTGTTDVEDGILVGSGDDRSGVGGSLFQRSPVGIGGGANTNGLTLDFSGTITAVDMHGSSFVGFETAVTLSNDATDGPNHVYAGATFSGCAMVASGRVVLRNVTFAGYTGTQGALDWQANANVRNSNFLGNTDVTNDPAGVYHQTEGDFSYIGLLFSGNDVDVRNANAATSVQSYPNTNQDSELAIGNGTTDAAAQSFAGVAGQLVKMMFHLRKVGTPTGNAVISLYAHSGTFGTSSVPTGAALVSAANFDVSTLTGTLADIEFVFDAAVFYDLLGATNYTMVIDCSGITGDGSNYVAVGYDGSAPTSAGNAASQASGGGWTAQAYDLIHQVWRDGEVQVNASSGSDPSTTSNTGSPSSATAIINTVSLTVEVLDEAGSPIQNAQTAIYATETAGGVSFGDELLSGSGGIDTNASGIAQNAGYNYGGAVDIEVRVRKSSTGATKYIPVEAAGAIGPTGFSTTITLRADPNAN